jgi:hypothetical protein
MEPRPHIALRTVAWPATVGALVVIAQLMAFHHVVRGAVTQGELQRELTALQSTAILRCNALRGRLVRDNCLSRLNALPADLAALRAQNALTTVALQQASR